MHKRCKQTEHKHFLLDKINKHIGRENTVLKDYLYFSEENGFTNKENVDADSITIQIDRRNNEYKVTDLDKRGKKKDEALSQISYNLPGSALIRVIYKGRLLSERLIPVAQLGIDVPLPQSLFSGKELPQIRFSEKTGNIVSVTK